MFWTLISFDDEQQCEAFHLAYMHCFIAIEDRDTIDLFSLYKGGGGERTTVYLPPYAAAMVREEMPDFASALQPCPAPPPDVRLMIGDTLATNPSWFELDEDERRAARDDCILSPDETDAQAAEFDEPESWMTLEEWSERNGHRMN